MQWTHLFLYLNIIRPRQSALKINHLNLAHTSTSELKTKNGTDKAETSDLYKDRLGFHEVGFLIGRIGDGEFFLFGSVINGENQRKNNVGVLFCPFFSSHVGRLARVLRGKWRTLFTLKNTSAKSAWKPKYFWE